MNSSNHSDHHLICLHGFLGLASDWSKLAPLAPESWSVQTENLWSQLGDFDTWARDFTERVGALSGTKILLGYSLGGRLALHALKLRPDLFEGAILVSTNPGLKSAAEREARLAADQLWADKFRRTEWSALMSEWNSQNVFTQPQNLASDAIVLARDESDFDRELLAESLELWSLGFQQDLEAALKELELPLLFITGQADAKFTALASALLQSPAWGDREHHVIDGAGHRVPWDAPQDFRSLVAKFLSRWYR